MDEPASPSDDPHRRRALRSVLLAYPGGCAAWLIASGVFVALIWVVGTVYPRPEEGAEMPSGFYPASLAAFLVSLAIALAPSLVAALDGLRAVGRVKGRDRAMAIAGLVGGISVPVAVAIGLVVALVVGMISSAISAALAWVAVALIAMLFHT